MIRLSRELFEEISGLASAGKRVKGLIHNLNSPLQNLGMDMDMIRYSIRNNKHPLPALLEEIEKRLNRMDEEFERVNQLIRSTAARVGSFDDGYLSLADFLDLETPFLNTNLYFKHTVESEILLDDELPKLHTLAKGVPEALRSLLEAVIEEMERLQLSRFSLAASPERNGVGIKITTGRGPVSDSFIKAAEGFSVEGDDTIVHHEQMAAAHAFMRLRRAGVKYEVTTDSESTGITLGLDTQD